MFPSRLVFLYFILSSVLPSEIYEGLALHTTMAAYAMEQSLTSANLSLSLNIY